MRRLNRSLPAPPGKANPKPKQVAKKANLPIQLCVLQEKMRRDDDGKPTYAFMGHPRMMQMSATATIRDVALRAFAKAHPNPRLTYGETFLLLDNEYNIVDDDYPMDALYKLKRGNVLLYAILEHNLEAFSAYLAAKVSGCSPRRTRPLPTFYWITFDTHAHNQLRVGSLERRQLN